MESPQGAAESYPREVMLSSHYNTFNSPDDKMAFSRSKTSAPGTFSTQTKSRNQTLKNATKSMPGNPKSGQKRHSEMPGGYSLAGSNATSKTGSPRRRKE